MMIYYAVYFDTAVYLHLVTKLPFYCKKKAALELQQTVDTFEIPSVCDTVYYLFLNTTYDKIDNQFQSGLSRIFIQGEESRTK